MLKTSLATALEVGHEAERGDSVKLVVLSLGPVFNHFASQYKKRHSACKGESAMKQASQDSPFWSLCNQQMMLCMEISHKSEVKKTSSISCLPRAADVIVADESTKAVPYLLTSAQV